MAFVLALVALLVVGTVAAVIVRDTKGGPEHPVADRPGGPGQAGQPAGPGELGPPER